MLIHVLHMHRAAAEKASEDIGLYRSQHMMLKYLIHLPYEPTQKQIAEALEISPAAVTVTLKKLESGGYISRKASERKEEILTYEVEEIYQTVPAVLYCRAVVYDS